MDIDASLLVKLSSETEIPSKCHRPVCFYSFYSAPGCSRSENELFLYLVREYYLHNLFPARTRDPVYFLYLVNVLVSRNQKKKKNVNNSTTYLPAYKLYGLLV